MGTAGRSGGGGLVRVEGESIEFGDVVRSIISDPGDVFNESTSSTFKVSKVGVGVR